MESKHTPGKWIYEIKAYKDMIPISIHIQVESENHFFGKSIARLTPISEISKHSYPLDETMANAKLCASAPEMLNVLCFLRDHFENKDWDDPKIDKFMFELIDKTIKKATE